MYSLNELVTLFLPEVSSEKQQEFLKLCENTAIDYDTKSWSVVTSQELSDDKIKANLVRTVFQVQENYDGVVSEILNSLEVWSNQTLSFDELDEDEQFFYERLYTFLSFSHFTFLSSVRQIFILGSRFLTLATIWNIPVFSKVEAHFARFCDVSVLEQDAALFAQAIMINPTPISEGVTVGGIIKKYRIAKDQAVEDYLVNVGKELSLDQSIIDALWTTITLFSTLISNEIWQNLTYSTCIHTKTDKREKFDPDEFYIHRLEKSKDLSLWLLDADSIATWAKNKSLSWIKQLVGVVKNKTDLSRDGEVVYTFVSALQEQNHPELDGVIYFDQSTSQFTWNTDLLT